jgi:hypothetical protein
MPAYWMNRVSHVRLLIVAAAGVAAMAAAASGQGEVGAPGEGTARAGAEAVPGLGQTNVRVTPARLLPEGTFLRRSGQMVRLPTGERAFVFDAEEGAPVLRPMVLVPSLTLQRMEQAVEEREAEMTVTGEVFAYLGVNYLLPATFSMGAPPAVAPAVPREPTPPGVDPAVEELIRELERQRARPRAIDPAAPILPPAGPRDVERREGAPGDGPGRGEARARPGTEAAPAGLLPEGQSVLRRRGRLIRLPGGEWAVAFDSGPRQEIGLDRPLVLTPSMNLQRMQAWAGRLGDRTPLEISGRVTQYHGRNYLVPTLFRVYPASTPLEPIQ